MGIAARLLDKSGAGDLAPQELKRAWYRLGTDFSFHSGRDETTVTISGLDENFGPSLELMMRVLNEPRSEAATLAQLVRILLGEREDARKDPRAIRGALALYNRHGQNSRYLRALPSERVKALAVSDLLGLVRGLPAYDHTLSYTGALPPDAVLGFLRLHHPLPRDLREPPGPLNLTARAPDDSQIRVFHKEMAQSRVYIEFGDVRYDESIVPAVQLFNSYFSGGMGGIVFQEIREARALAYAVGAGYATGDRKGEQNLFWGGMGTQADKTTEAVKAFIGLIDEMPRSPDRFDSAKESLVNRYRTGKLGFREVLGAVRSWERLGLEPDPRRRRFQEIRDAGLDLVLDFHDGHIRDRAKLISIVGDTSRIDMGGLRTVAEPEPVTLDQIFVE